MYSMPYFFIEQFWFKERSLRWRQCIFLVYSQRKIGQIRLIITTHSYLMTFFAKSFSIYFRVCISNFLLLIFPYLLSLKPMNKKTRLLTWAILFNSFACKQANTNDEPFTSTQQENTSTELVTVLETHTGIASYYGKWDWFAGKRMANGDLMNPNELTAAHRTRAFGTEVRVIHQNESTQTADTVIVKIADRGPYTKEEWRYNRILDLSYNGAVKLGMVKKGHANVTVEVLKRGKKRKKARNKQTRK